MKDEQFPVFTTNANTTSDTPTIEQLNENAKKFRDLIDHGRIETGLALMSHGIQLIPMEHLSDSQFGVSQAMYDAVVRHLRKHGAESLFKV